MDQSFVRCSACKLHKPPTDFHKGQNQCKVCHKATRHKWNTSPKGRSFYAARMRKMRASGTPQQRAMLKAHKYINKAVRFGRIPRAKDLLCTRGSPAEHYHHHKGYEPPNHKIVTPLCAKCHREADHKK